MNAQLSLLVRARWALGLLFGCALAAGCVNRPAVATSQEDALRPVHVQAQALLTGSTAEAALSARQLVARVSELRAQGRNAQAQRLVRRFPEVADLALSEPALWSDPALQGLAEIVEQIEGSGPGWSAMLADCVLAPEHCADFVRAHAEVLADLQAGQISRARTRFPLPAVAHGLTTKAPALVEARLRGIVALLDDDPLEAAADWERAAKLAEGSPRVQASALMLRSIALERARSTTDAAASWTAAVALAARGSDDPSFWERAISARPAIAVWPEAVTQANAALDGTEAEASAWARIGRLRLDRGEANASLIAFSRAEGLAQQPSQRDRMRLGQARSLVQLRQLPQAQALASGLAVARDAQVAREAIALLGGVELALERPARARALLEGLPGKWPEPSIEAAQALANLGIACLLLDDEEPGLRCLHRAQEEFEACADIEGLLQALRNERRHLEATGKSAALPAIDARIAAALRA